jgi:hypothetical protein
MNDCRLALDNLNDQSAVEGQLITGSDAIDVSGAQMTPLDDHWQVRINTVNPAPQNPRLSVSAALYLDADGRFENNAAAGTRLGADQVYGIVSGPDGWKFTREMFDPGVNGFVTAKTGATFSFEDNAYVIDIPYAELPREAKAHWRAGIAVKDGNSLAVDYVPDGGYSCAAALIAPNPWILKAQELYRSDVFREAALFSIVIIALAVIFWRKRKNRNKRP